MKTFWFALGAAAIGLLTMSAAASPAPIPEPVAAPSPTAVAGAVVLGGLILVGRWLKRKN